MNITKLITLIVLSAGCTLANASQLGLYERFCLDSKIGDACGKASKSLAEKLSAANHEENQELKMRLENVATFGCQLEDKVSCRRMKELKAEAFNAEVDSEFMAQKDIEDLLEAPLQDL